MADSSILPVQHNERCVIQLSYGMNRVRVACHRLKILVHVEKYLAHDVGSQVCCFTGLQEFVRQSGDLIVCAPLDRKLMKLMQSLEDADASPLTCNNMSERALQTLKPRNVLNRDPHEGRVGVNTIAWDLSGFSANPL